MKILTVERRWGALYAADDATTDALTQMPDGRLLRVLVMPDEADLADVLVAQWESFTVTWAAARKSGSLQDCIAARRAWMDFLHVEESERAETRKAAE